MTRYIQWMTDVESVQPSAAIEYLVIQGRPGLDELMYVQFTIDLNQR